MEITSLKKTKITHSSEFPLLDFTEAEMIEAWRQFPDDRNCYKLESEFCLDSRCGEGFTNFPNIGGNFHTRPKLILDEEEVFIEANWITDRLIATGYPTAGKMRDHYWYMVHSLLQEKKNVFIINFMHQDDINPYGGWFFPTKDSPTIESKVKSWERKISFISKEQKEGWERQTHTMDDLPFSLFHYPTWKDHGMGEEEIVIALLKELYESMQKAPNAVAILGCRAGVGRTGTFTVLFYFYSLLQEKKTLCKEDFDLKAIQRKIIEYREARGDVQFVQTSKQFMMLCRVVQRLYNEAIS